MRKQQIIILGIVFGISLLGLIILQTSYFQTAYEVKKEQFFYSANRAMDDMVDYIRKQEEATSVYESLKQIMQLADFVKFAKMNPLPDENDLSLMNAYLFINQTKMEEIPVPGEGEKVEGEVKPVEKNDSNISKE